MKLYLASFLQMENFGPGRIIAICGGKKPNHVDVQHKFDPFIPALAIMNKYYSEKNTNENAGAEFVEAYSKQLETFLNECLTDAKNKNMSVQDLLQFKDGDTFASWERAEFHNYRRILAGFLEKLGYEVELH